MSASRLRGRPLDSERARELGRKGGKVTQEERRARKVDTASALLDTLATETFFDFYTVRLGLGGPTRAAWVVVAKLLSGLPLTAVEMDLYRTLSGGRTTLPTNLSELWLIFGRGSGKTEFEGALAAYKATRRYALSKGQKAVISLMAGDRDQAGTLFAYVRAFLVDDPELSRLVLSPIRQDRIALVHGVVIQIGTAHWKRIRGPAYALLDLDEAAFMWSDELAANPDREVIRAGKPGLLKIPGGGLLVVASTPYWKQGAVWDAYEASFGKEDPRTLVLQGPTRLLNPTMDAEAIAAEVARDPLAASEYAAEWRADGGEFLSPAAVDACIQAGVFERAPDAARSYVAFVDMSGGGADSCVLAIGHGEARDGQKVFVLDVVREHKPPLDINGTVAEWADMLGRYNLRTVTGDNFAAQLTRETFAAQGITYLPSKLSASELYIEALSAINTRQVVLLDHAVLREQLVSLIRRPRQRGQDLVTHPAGQHDDVSNVVCGAISLVLVPGEKRRTVQWSGMTRRERATAGLPAPVGRPLGLGECAALGVRPGTVQRADGTLEGPRRPMPAYE